MNALVGYTGFVGSNIYVRGRFDRVYNSRNIKEAYGLKPDLLIYAGLRAEKYLANNEPKKDMELIVEAENNIKKIQPKKLVLISTIDVLKNPVGVNEDIEIDTNGLQAYGLNRYRLECWVRENYYDSLIIRLPGLYGINIKKNFIYDYMNVIPFMLKEDKFTELLSKKPDLGNYYERQGNGFYRCKQIEEKDRIELREEFKNIGFTALNFTDSRSIYQFYPLERLWDDIHIALDNNIQLWHPATEPLSAAELYYFLEGKSFLNELPGVPVYYDYRTKYGKIFGTDCEYILNKQSIMKSIQNFINVYSNSWRTPQ